MQTTNTTTTPSAVTMKQHPFEKAGLGVAPFRLVGVSQSTYQACHGAPIQPGTSCDYCGTGIMYVFMVQGACGSKFKVGCDCVEKVDQGQLAHEVKHAAKRLKAEAKEEREAVAGKRKALAYLTETSKLAAWEIFADEDMSKRESWKNEEWTVRDIVGKLVKYGSISERAESYLGNLLARIADRPALVAKKAEEKAAAANCPAGRVIIEGVIVSKKLKDTAFGSTWKMLVQHATGYKVWGTIPSNLTVEKGDTVSFMATVEPSADDVKFGFFAHPSKARVVTAYSGAANDGAMEDDYDGRP